jgi:hypothetical protein
VNSNKSIVLLYHGGGHISRKHALSQAPPFPAAGNSLQVLLCAFPEAAPATGLYCGNKRLPLECKRGTTNDANLWYNGSGKRSASFPGAPWSK